MPVTTVASLRPVHKLIPLIPDSDLAHLIAEGYALAEAEPHILDLIDRDRDTAALLKKKQRIEDQDWLTTQGLALPGLDVKATATWAVDLDLGVGRPRLPAIGVLIFVLIRGYFGGFKDRKTATLLAESKTLEICFANLSIPSPGASTIIDNVNAVSLGTLEAILDAQIRAVLRTGLDNFEELTFDSTKVRANSAWPTDSGLIAGLVCRAEHLIRSLADQGISLKLPAVMVSLRDEIIKGNKQIQLSSGKKNSAKRRATLYRRLLRRARKVLRALDQARARADEKFRALDVMPSKRRLVATIIEWITVDCRNLAMTISNAEGRINRDKKIPTQQKVLSLSDQDAAMIVKGEREPVVGYKPQLGRSKSGFVVALIVPEGNAADSGQIEAIVDSALRRTGIVPKILSFDDGYTNTKARERYLAAGIAVVSFSGSKGKSIIPTTEYDRDDYRQARNDRSAVESLMSTLKYNHDLDRVMRRGISSVRGELLEKVIAYNFFCLIRRRCEHGKQIAAA